jgi:hypothetical protein
LRWLIGFIGGVAFSILLVGIWWVASGGLMMWIDQEALVAVP